MIIKLATHPSTFKLILQLSQIFKSTLHFLRLSNIQDHTNRHNKN